MRLATTYGQTWVTTSAEVADQVKRLEDACLSAGRDPTTIDRLLLTGPDVSPGLDSEASFADTVGHYRDVGITDLVVHWPRPSEPYAGDVATFERVVSGR
jgi:hypothetical protein